MRTFVLLAVSVFVIAWGDTGSAQTLVSTNPQGTYLCPKCGQLHYKKDTPEASELLTTPSVVSTPIAGEVRTVSYQPAAPSNVPMAGTSAMRSTGGVSNVLGALNAQRARQGLFSLVYDPALQMVAQRRAQRMASSGLKNHPPGSFSPGRYEGVGWSSSYSPSKVSACFTSDTRMRYAGAAMATGRDGVYFAVVYR